MVHHRKRPHLLRTDVADKSVARSVQRAHLAGALVPVHRGVFMAKDEWEGLDDAGRHLARARAVAPSLATDTAFSHITAAVSHGWPVVGPLPVRVHVTDEARTATAHRSGLVRHAGPLPALDAVRLDGVPVTAPLPTAVALIATTPVHVAAVAVDTSVRNGSLRIEDVAAALPSSPARGSARGRLVISALDRLHESVGESFAAIRLVELGAPEVVPQHEFVLADGSTCRVDFWIPELGVVVEFDGRQKYVDPAMTGGADPTDVLWREKLREDRLRSRPEVRAVVRVTWWHLVDLDRFRALFRAHGIRF